VRRSFSFISGRFHNCSIDILYRQQGAFAEQSRALMQDVVFPESGIYHYRSMAKTNFSGDLQSELVPLKKYFYVLRPLLAVRWLVRYGTPAPIEFHELLGVLDRDHDLLEAIHALLEQKRVSPELGLSPHVPAIQDFIVKELERLAAIAPARCERENIEPPLSALLRHVLAKA
jgi:predicted nucleotidyltransferase